MPAHNHAELEFLQMQSENEGILQVLKLSRVLQVLAKQAAYILQIPAHCRLQYLKPLPGVHRDGEQDVTESLLCH